MVAGRWFGVDGFGGRGLKLPLRVWRLRESQSLNRLRVLRTVNGFDSWSLYPTP